MGEGGNREGNCPCETSKSVGSIERGETLRQYCGRRHTGGKALGPPPPDREEHDGQRLRKVIEGVCGAVKGRNVTKDVLVDEGKSRNHEAAGNGIVEDG